MGLGWFYIGNRLQKTQPDQILRKRPVLVSITGGRSIQSVLRVARVFSQYYGWPQYSVDITGGHSIQSEATMDPKHTYPTKFIDRI